jgi:hypothetical protein
MFGLITQTSFQQAKEKHPDKQIYRQIVRIIDECFYENIRNNLHLIIFP